MYDFSPEGYFNLISSLKSSNYIFCKFPQKREPISLLPFILIRHDVDWSIKGAFEIARIESEVGVQSTFFFLLRSPFYNLLCEDVLNTLTEICKLKHDVALHVDFSIYNKNLEEKLNREIKIIAHYFPQFRKDIVSLHRPMIKNGQSLIKLKTISHTYEKRFFHDIGYISDSRGNWKYGNPQESEIFKSTKPFQLVTHPLWWTEHGETPDEKFYSFLINQRSTSIEYLKNSVSFPINIKDIYDDGNRSKKFVQ